jgi:hypothetical protein
MSIGIKKILPAPDLPSENPAPAQEQCAMNEKARSIHGSATKRDARSLRTTTDCCTAAPFIL